MTARLHSDDLDPFAPLVDPRFGLIHSLRALPTRSDLPMSLCRAQAEVADSSRFSPWSCDDRAGGFCWNSPAAARAAAAGEAVERYCGNLVPAGLRRASYDELRRLGEAAVDPESLVLFNDEQYAVRGFPFTPFTRRLPVLWTRGRSLDPETSGEPTWVPASLVWVTFFTAGPTRHEPRTHATPYAGIATGPDREWAETAALFELFERDAAAFAWHGGGPLPRLEVPAWIRATVEMPRLHLAFHLFPNPFDVPVLGALAHDEDRDLYALGLAARADPAAAALKAAAEALQLIVTSRILDDPESPYMRRVAAGAPGLGVKPWRADRAYRRLYREDWRDAWDLLCHLQLYQDPEMRAPLVERFENQPVLRLAEVAASGGVGRQEQRSDLIRRLAARGHTPVAVDVTTADVAAAGLDVVRVIAPGLHGNAPAAFPYLGGPRLAAMRSAGRLYHWPMPYA